MKDEAAPDKSRLAAAFFISPHGFGHAARAAAVAEALTGLDKNIRIELFTTVPRWFFETSLTGSFSYNYLSTDVGLVQRDPLHIDLDATIDRLAQFFPPDETFLGDIVKTVRKMNCRLIVCDIAPLGLAVAGKAGIPSVLIENFTWDWIYSAYIDTYPELIPHIKFMETLFGRADYHIQAEPVCRDADADLRTRPISRRPRSTPAEVRQRLNIPEEVKLVLTTMGGVPADFSFIDSARKVDHVHFLFPFANRSQSVKSFTEGNITVLPHHSEFYHPDLVRAADLVVGKVGYSTLAEVYNAGTAYGYILRPNFRESGALEQFIQSSIPGGPVAESEFVSGEWLSRLDYFFAFSPGAPRVRTGADEAGGFLYRILSESL